MNLNRRIITAAQLAQQSLYEMCTGFKEMRDSKLYKELGYSNFEDYCEQEVGIKRNQVYKYIAVAQKLPEDFVSSRIQIGVSKLLLLTTLSEEERAEISENTDLENTSIRELEKQIKQLKAEKDKAVAEKSAVEAESAAREDTVKALEKTKQGLEKRIVDLESEIKTLEKRPVEIQYVEKVPENYIALEAYQKMANDYNKRFEEAEDEYLKQKRAAHEEKAELEKQLADVRKQLDKAKKAPPSKTDTEGVFKAYFENAYKALDTLVTYVQQHTEYSSKVTALVDNIKSSLEA